MQFAAEIARIRKAHALHQRHAKHPPVLCIPCALHHAHAADAVIREQQLAVLLMQDAFPVDNRHLRLDADAAQPLDWRAICDNLRQRGRKGRRGAAVIRQQTQGAAVAAELGLGASAAADDNAVRPKLLPIR